MDAEKDHTDDLTDGSRLPSTVRVDENADYQSDIFSPLLWSDSLVRRPSILGTPRQSRYPSLHGRNTAIASRRPTINFRRKPTRQPTQLDTIAEPDASSATTQQVDLLYDSPTHGDLDGTSLVHAKNVQVQQQRKDGVEPERSDEDRDSECEELVDSNTQQEQSSPQNAKNSAEQNYSSFSPRQKLGIIFTAAFAGCFGPFTSNVFYPAVTTISKDLQVTTGQVNYSITAFIILQALTPLVLSPIADVRGRRPAYILGFSIYIVANLGLALNNSYIGLILLRCLQSCGSSGLTAMGTGTISDLVTRAEIGKYIAITSMSNIIAPSLGPLCGGFLAQYLGWHAIFWFLFIASSLFFVGLVLWLPETCRSVVGDGSIPPPPWNRPLADILGSRRRFRRLADHEADSPDPTPTRTTARKPVKLADAFRILKSPESALIILFSGISSIPLSVLSTTVAVQFHSIYGLSSSMQGLLFLTQIVGGSIAAAVNSKLLDFNYQRHAAKAGLIMTDNKKQPDLTKMPIEAARLEVAIPAHCSLLLLIVCYGWLLEAKVFIAIPIIVALFMNIVTGIGFAPLAVLNVDLNRERASSASAANTLVRCIFTAVTSATIDPIISEIGNGWTYTIVGLLNLASLPMLWICWKRGMQMRAKQKAKEEAKEEKSEKSVNDFVPRSYRFKRWLERFPIRHRDR